MISIRDKLAVNTLLVHLDVRAVSFVGSTSIANYIYAIGARHGKRVQALGGAKNRMMAMPAADIDQTVDTLIGAGYDSAGKLFMDQYRRLVVDAGNKVIDKLVTRTR